MAFLFGQFPRPRALPPQKECKLRLTDSRCVDTGNHGRRIVTMLGLWGSLQWVFFKRPDPNNTTHERLFTIPHPRKSFQRGVFCRTNKASGRSISVELAEFPWTAKREASQISWHPAICRWLSLSAKCASPWYSRLMQSPCPYLSANGFLRLTRKRL
jgi:hypothetical protein